MTQVSIKIGEAGSIDVDVTALQAMPAVSAYVWNYGLKQMLNDVHASVTKKVEADDTKRAAAKRALVEKKLESLMAGEVAQARVGTSGSPVEREMAKMAEADLKAKLIGIGKKAGDYDKAVWASVVQKQVAKNEAAYRAAAEAKLAIKPDVEDDFDIMSLLDDAAEERVAAETSDEEAETE